MAPLVTCNALALRPDGTGVQTYIRELLTALAAGGGLELRAVVQADAASVLPAGVGAIVRPPSSGLRRAIQGLRSVGDSDLVHGLDVDLPWRADAPTVSTVHDLSVFDVPESFSGRRARGERAILRHTLGRADGIIAVSSFTAERLQALLGRPATVVLEAPPSDLAIADQATVEAVRARYGLPERFVLHVGTIEPRKEVDLLAAACATAGLPLVLAGGLPRGRRAPSPALLLGYVPRADLPGLYGASTTVAYPSRYEGFGLPPLEAMVCGAPVVAAAASSLPESLGNGALFVPPGDESAWAAALASVAHDAAHREALATAGRAWAGRRTWGDVATETVAAYERLGLPV